VNQHRRLDLIEQALAATPAPSAPPRPMTPEKLHRMQGLFYRLVERVRAQGIDPMTLPDPGPNIKAGTGTEAQRLGAVLGILRRIKARVEAAGGTIHEH